MKLLTKTTLNFLSLTLFIFLFGTVSFYYLLRTQINNSINSELLKRQKAITEQIQVTLGGDKIPPPHDEIILIEPLDTFAKSFNYFSDTLIKEKATGKLIPYRQLTFVTNVENRSFYIQVFRSLEESDALTIRIFLLMTSLVILLIVILLIINRFALENAWKSFYNTIKKIAGFNVNSPKELALEVTDIQEFDDLNKVLNKMTTRIKEDYLNLKEFTENASHEMQTPLAVISAKIELLLQGGNLNEDQYKLLSDAYDASIRLSRMNKTLLLLTKIENRQFPDSEWIDTKNIIQQQIEMLIDLVEDKKIDISLPDERYPRVLMNPYLGQILLSNLLKNAVRHNVEDGKIIIRGNSNMLSIANTGINEALDPKIIFTRFSKKTNSAESLGLGMALVIKICNIYQFKISYRFEKNMHIMVLTFDNESFNKI